MEKIGLVIKQAAENRIKERIKVSDAVFVIQYSGLSAIILSDLRQALKGSNATLFVIKNSVARRALQDSGLEMLSGNIEGPCGMVFVNEEPVATSKVLAKFAKEFEQLKLGGGCLKDKLIEKKDIESMARLPSREVLLAQIVMTLNAPITGITRTLNQIIKKFVYCLEQVKEKKRG